MLETLKLMVELYRTFDIRLSDPEFVWTIDGSWLTTQHMADFEVSRVDRTG